MPVLRITMPMTKAIATKAEGLSDGQLYRVLTWFSPGFPIGAGNISFLSCCVILLLGLTSSSGMPRSIASRTSE